MLKSRFSLDRFGDARPVNDMAKGKNGRPVGACRVTHPPMEAALAQHRRSRGGSREHIEVRTEGAFL